MKTDSHHKLNKEYEQNNKQNEENCIAKIKILQRNPMVEQNTHNLHHEYYLGALREQHLNAEQKFLFHEQQHPKLIPNHHHQHYLNERNLQHEQNWLQQHENYQQNIQQKQNLLRQHDELIIQHQQHIEMEHHQQMHMNQRHQYQHHFVQQQEHNLNRQQSPIQQHSSQQQQQINSVDNLMVEDQNQSSNLDPNNRHKLLSPNIKPESQDDGYETSAGDVLTPNSHSLSSVPIMQYQIQQQSQLIANQIPSHKLNESSSFSSGGSTVLSSSAASTPPHTTDLSIQHTTQHLNTPNTPQEQLQHHLNDDSYNFIDDECHLLSPGLSRSNDSSNIMGRQQRQYLQHPIRSDFTHQIANENIIRNQNAFETSGMLPQANNMQLLNCHEVMNENQVSNQLGQSRNYIRNSCDSGQIVADLNVPKKRGRKKKIRDENGTIVNGILKPIINKQRKKHDRFNGMSEEEVSKRTLPDHLAQNLDIIIIGINPGLFAAYNGHHYAGPGNHFWKCLYLSGLTHEQMSAEEDYKLINLGIGFTNMVQRATKGSADLTRKEIKEGCRLLIKKLEKFQPKIAVFNGKLIFEVFSGKKDFNFGRQPDCIEGTNTYMWVMPSSSARCAQLPRAADKVPFYSALKKFRDYLNGLITHLDESELIFNDPKYKQCCESEDAKSSTLMSLTSNPNYHSSISFDQMDAENMKQIGGNCSAELMLKPVGDYILGPAKKKRGRPKKNKLLQQKHLGEYADDMQMLDGQGATKIQTITNSKNFEKINDQMCKEYCENGIPKRKRGRPKKIKDPNAMGTLKAQQQNFQNGNTNILTNNNNSCSSNSQNSITLIGNNAVNLNSLNANLDNTELHRDKTSSFMNQENYMSHTLNSKKYNTPEFLQKNSTVLVSCFPPSELQYKEQPVNPYPNQNFQSHQQIESYLPVGKKSPTPTADLSQEISTAISGGNSFHHPKDNIERNSEIHAAPPNQQPNAIPSNSQEYNLQQRHNKHEQNFRYNQPNPHFDQNLNVPHTYNQFRNLASPYSTKNSLNPDLNQIRNNELETCSNVNRGGIVTSSILVQSPNQLNTHRIDTNSIKFTQPTQNLKKAQQTQSSDVTMKSLSGLESLVEQIPTVHEHDSNTSLKHNQENSEYGGSSNLQEHQSNSNDFVVDSEFKNHQNGAQSNNLYTNNSKLRSNTNSTPIYLNQTGNFQSSVSGARESGLQSPTPAAVATNQAKELTIASSTSQQLVPLSKQHVPSATQYSPPILAPTPTSNTYSPTPHSYVAALSSNFSVSSLTSQSYPNTYHHPGNFHPHHMYMDHHPPHLSMPINPLYQQYQSYGGYSSSGSISNPNNATSTPSTLHMPAPNYPYGYGNQSGYSLPHHQPTGHSSHPAGYLNHPGMFDRFKSDLGYGGF